MGCLLAYLRAFGGLSNVTPGTPEVLIYPARFSISIIFFDEVRPEMIEMAFLGHEKCLASNFMSASLAFPSTGGEDNLIFRLPLAIFPTTSFVDERGTTLTVNRIGKKFV